MTVEDRRALGARFAHNLKRLLDEKRMSKAALGRKLYPKQKNPTAAVAVLFSGKALPGEKVTDSICEALGCKVNELHAGELETFREADEKSQTGRTRGTGRTRSGTRTNTDEHGRAPTYLSGLPRPALLPKAQAGEYRQGVSLAPDGNAGENLLASLLDRLRLAARELSPLGKLSLADRLVAMIEEFE